VYLAPEASEALVRRLGALLPCAACVVYEQIRPDDAFGRQMVINLEARPQTRLHRQQFASSRAPGCERSWAAMLPCAGSLVDRLRAGTAPDRRCRVRQAASLCALRRSVFMRQWGLALAVVT